MRGSLFQATEADEAGTAGYSQAKVIKQGRVWLLLLPEVKGITRRVDFKHFMTSYKLHYLLFIRRNELFPKSLHSS